MKKLFFTLTLALSVVAVSAQNMWVGGTAGVWSNHINGGGDSEISFKVMPEFGFVLNDNIGIGIALGGGHTHLNDLNFQEATQISSQAVNFYKVNPFVRYTFLKSTLGGLFVDGGMGYGYEKAGGYKAYSIEAGLRPGVAINLSSKFALIGKFGFLGYEHKRVNQRVTEYISGWGDITFDQKGRSNDFGLDFNLDNIQLGGVFKF